MANHAACKLADGCTTPAVTEIVDQRGIHRAGCHGHAVIALRIAEGTKVYPFSGRDDEAIAVHLEAYSAPHAVLHVCVDCQVEYADDESPSDFRCGFCLERRAYLHGDDE